MFVLQGVVLFRGFEPMRKYFPSLMNPMLNPILLMKDILLHPNPANP